MLTSGRGLGPVPVTPPPPWPRCWDVKVLREGVCRASFSTGLDLTSLTNRLMLSSPSSSFDASVILDTEVGGLGDKESEHSAGVFHAFPAAQG